MESYIVRIYRREKKHNRLLGVLEEAGANSKKAFHTIQELTSFLKKDSFIERRQAGRLKLRLPVKVRDMSTSGKRFVEETTLEDLSPKGAYFHVKNPVSKDTRLRLLIDEGRSDLNVKSRVVRLAGRGRIKGVGVFFE